MTILLGLGSIFSNAEHVIDESTKPQYLTVLSAASGTYSGDTLTLKGVPNVVYFSDRPDRIAGHMSVDSFVSAWDKGKSSFRNDPPNATLSIFHESVNKTSVMELTNPVVKGDSISFKVKVISSSSIPDSFNHVSLFIDLYGIDTAATAVGL